MKRRTFAAVAGVLPLIAQTPVKKIRVAMIGTGHGHAGSKVRALLSTPEYELVGIARPDADDPKIGEIFDQVRPLTLAQVLDDPTVELVAAESADAERNLEYARLAVDAESSCIWINLRAPIWRSFGMCWTLRGSEIGWCRWAINGVTTRQCRRR